MTTLRYTLPLVLAAFAAVGGFVATQAWQPVPAASSPATPPCAVPCSQGTCCKALVGWLNLTREQTERLAGIDSAFTEESRRLEDALFAEREKLAALFESAEADDETIQQQVEKVIAAGNALERRVAAHLLALRPHLNDDQRTRLYQRCAKGIREAGGCQRWQQWQRQYRDRAGPGCSSWHGAECGPQGHGRHGHGAAPERGQP